MAENYKSQKEQIEAKLDEKFAERIRQRFQQKSVIRSARLVAENLKLYSWAINALSFLLAVYAVYFFASLYPTWKFAGLLFLGIALLASWEIGKRKSIIIFSEGILDQAKRGNLAMGVVVLFLLAGSMATTYYGGNRLVVEESSTPEQIHTSAIDSLSSLIAQAETDKNLMKSQTWKGVITRDARKQMAGLQKRIDFLLSEKLSLEQADRKENGNILVEHKSRIANFGLIFGAIGVLLDFVLIGFLFVAEKKEFEAFCLIEKSVPKRSLNVPNRSGNRSDKRQDTSKDKPVSVPNVAAHKRSIGFIKEPISVPNGRVCLSCGTDIQNRRSDAKYCSASCRKDYWAKNA